MIVFKQKNYNVEDYSSIIINNGSEEEALKENPRRNNSKTAQAEDLNEEKKVLNNFISNQLKRDRLDGIQARSELLRANRISRLNQLKDHSAKAGIRESREFERKANLRNTSEYKTPTKILHPIKSN